MTTDIFTKQTNEQKVLEFIRENTWVRSSTLQAFGTRNHINEPGRYARKLAEQGKIKRMSDEDRLRRFGKSCEKIWEMI